MSEQNNSTAADNKAADEAKKKADAAGKKKADAEAKKKTDEAKKKNKVKGIRVIAKRDSFWRAGINFGGEPVDLVLSDLKDEQVKMIHDEPMLIVTDIELDA